MRNEPKKEPYRKLKILAIKISFFYRWLFFILLLLALPAFSQTEPVNPVKITEEDLQPYRDNPDFDYVSADGVSWIALFWEWLKRAIRNILEAIFGNAIPENMLVLIFEILPYVAIAILLFIFYKLILKGLLKGNATRPPKEALVAMTDDEKLIREADLPALQNEALQQNNYRLALRYGYLIAIKKLSENGSIKLMPDKTNTDYLNELVNSPFEAPFTRLTHWYDYIWYGNMPLDATRYENLSQLIVQFNSTKA